MLSVCPCVGPLIGVCVIGWLTDASLTGMRWRAQGRRRPSSLSFCCPRDKHTNVSKPHKAVHSKDGYLTTWKWKDQCAPSLYVEWYICQATIRRTCPRMLKGLLHPLKSGTILITYTFCYNAFNSKPNPKISPQLIVDVLKINHPTFYSLSARLSYFHYSIAYFFRCSNLNLKGV